MTERFSKLHYEILKYNEQSHTSVLLSIINFQVLDYFVGVFKALKRFALKLQNITNEMHLIFVFPCIIIYGFIRTSLMEIV